MRNIFNPLILAACLLMAWPSVSAQHLGGVLNFKGLATLNDGKSMNGYKVTDVTVAGLYMLEELVIGEDVTEIRDDAIDAYNAQQYSNWRGAELPGLKTITSLAPQPPIMQRYLFAATTKPNVTLYVPEGAQDAYRRTPEWSGFYNIQVVGVPETTVVPRGLSVLRRGDGIEVAGMPEETPIRVYGIDGTMVYSGTGTTVTGLERGVYIVSAGGRQVKVRL